MKKICVVCVHTCWSQSSSIWVVAFLSGKNALNVKFVKAHWHECSIETMPTYILYMQTFPIAKDLLRALFCKLPCWRSKRSHALDSSPKLASNWRDESENCLKYSLVQEQQ